MSGTRLAPSLASALLCSLLGCGSAVTTENTALNVIVEDGGADDEGIDIQSVQYTIACSGEASPFAGDNGFDPSVRIDGTLNAVDGPTPGTGTVFQAFENLPPGPCDLQLRAYDNDGERICVADQMFTVVADTTTQVNVLLICTISFQLPVGMANIDATFSFVVGNFCPDLFTLNMIDNDPAVSGVEVQVRGYDPDSTCGNNCDPQTCNNTIVPPVCTPGPDNGVSITVATDIGTFDCDQDGTADGTSCGFMGDLFNTGNVTYACDATMPGATATITATITDGDVDCDETKQLSITCP